MKYILGNCEQKQYYSLSREKINIRIFWEILIYLFDYIDDGRLLAVSWIPYRIDLISNL